MRCFASAPSRPGSRRTPLGWNGAGPAGRQPRRRSCRGGDGRSAARHAMSTASPISSASLRSRFRSRRGSLFRPRLCHHPVVMRLADVRPGPEIRHGHPSPAPTRRTPNPWTASPPAPHRRSDAFEPSRAPSGQGPGNPTCETAPHVGPHRDPAHRPCGSPVRPAREGRGDMPSGSRPERLRKG